MKTDSLISTVPDRLADFFETHPRIALAFSGGVDSAYLLYAARECGCTVTAYYLHSVFQPEFELTDARRLTERLGTAMKVLQLDILSNKLVADNPYNRCYYCKTAIFSKIRTAASADGFTLVVDGTNASDEVGDRPGMTAVAELGIVSPLREAGITKAEIRRLSQKAGLFTWDKPAYACLATRIPAGQMITKEKLAKVERGESYLVDCGFTDFRLRLDENKAILQLTESQFQRAAEMRQAIYDRLSVDFDRIFIDTQLRKEEKLDG